MRRSPIRQFQKLLEPLFFGFAKLFYLIKTLCSTYRPTNRYHKNIDQLVLPGSFYSWVFYL